MKWIFLVINNGEKDSLSLFNGLLTFMGHLMQNKFLETRNHII